MKILVTTPIQHLPGVFDLLSSINGAYIKYLPDPSLIDLHAHSDAIAIFTNPNKSKINYTSSVLSLFPRLKVFCTASTGTNHVDKDYLINNNVPILSLTNERLVINSITSTAEHAFLLTLASLRRF